MIIPPPSVPLVTAEPTPGSPDAFNEDDFVALWSQMYAVLLMLNFITRKNMHYPSSATGRHANLGLSGLAISPAATSLLERLPYHEPVWRDARMQMFTEAVVLNYLDPEDRSRCRDPHEEGSSLLPDDVALTLPYESEGIVWILDLKHNAFRVFRDQDDPPAPYWNHGVLENPEGPSYYWRWPLYHAPSVLRQWLEALRKLDTVPSSSENGESFSYSIDVSGLIIGKVLRGYGWPDNFREQDWAQDAKGIYNEAYEIEAGYHEALTSARYFAHKDELVAQWRRNPEQVLDVGMNPAEYAFDLAHRRGRLLLSQTER